MFDNLDALVALEQYGTMSRAAAHLGVTQSAISKRLHSLEEELGKKLLEPDGRRVALTPFAVRLIERAKPLYQELKEALSEEIAEHSGELSIVFSGALLLSWGDNVLPQIREENPNIIFSISSHRSPVATALVRSGDAMVAIVHGSSELTHDLSAKFLTKEEFIIVPSKLKPFRFPTNKALSLLTVESHSETWSVMERKLRRGSKKWQIEFEPFNKMQNFMSVTQLARAGFGHGLVPIGVALALGIPKKKLVHFPDGGLYLPVSLVGRGTTLKRSIVTQFYDSLFNALKKR